MPAFSVCSTILSIHLAYVLTADFVNLFSISMSETNHLSLVLNAFIEVYKTSSMHADVLGTNQNYLVTWRRFFFCCYVLLIPVVFFVRLLLVRRLDEDTMSVVFVNWELNCCKFAIFFCDHLLTEWEKSHVFIWFAYLNPDFIKISRYEIITQF